MRVAFAAWHLAAGICWDDTARALGQSDTAMRHKVYGHLTADELRDRMARYAPGGAGPGIPSPNSPRYGAEGAEMAVRADMEKASNPSGNEAFSWYRRSELNQRPWDYDSPALTD